MREIGEVRQVAYSRWMLAFRANQLCQLPIFESLEEEFRAFGFDIPMPSNQRFTLCRGFPCTGTRGAEPQPNPGYPFSRSHGDGHNEEGRKAVTQEERRTEVDEEGGEAVTEEKGRDEKANDEKGRQAFAEEEGYGQEKNRQVEGGKAVAQEVHEAKKNKPRSLNRVAPART